MLLYASILVLLTLGGNQALQCDSLDKLANNETEFHKCIISGVWNRSLPLDKIYNVEENETCSWCVEVMPIVLANIKAVSASNVEQLIATGSSFAVKNPLDSELIRDSFLMEVCGSLSGSETRAQCESIAKTYYKMIITMVGAGVPNERICSLLNVCKIKENICYTSPKVVCANITTARRCGMTDLCMNYEWKKNEKVDIDWVTVSSDAECLECKAFIDTLKKYLSDPKNRETIIDDAEKICTRFFSEEKCDEYVGESIGTIIMMLENDVSGEQVCSLVGMCSTESEEKKSNGLLGADECVASLQTICADFQYAQRCGKMLTCLEYSKQNMQKGNHGQLRGDGILCETCEEVVETAKQYLESNTNTIETEVLQLCDKCPAKDECVTLVKQYLPDLLKLVEANMDGNAICQMMKLCGNTKVKSVKHESLYKISGEDKTGEVMCDSTHYCPSFTTCCALASGSFGCCPQVDAVCCPDKVHCCPNGYTCNAGACYRSADNDISFMIRLRNHELTQLHNKRDRRQVRPEPESTEFEVPKFDVTKLADWGKEIAGQFISKLNGGTCTACKLVMKYKIDETASEMYSDEYWINLKDKVCNEAEKTGVDCPTVEGVRGIIEAGEVYPDEDCPIKSLCEGSIDDIMTQINDVMCSLYGKMLDTIEDSESWEFIFKMIEDYTEDKPLMKSHVDTVMEHARDLSENEQNLSKKKAMIASFLENVPGFAQCNITE